MTAPRTSRAQRFLRLLEAIALCGLALFATPSDAAREQSVQFGDIDAVVWTPEANAGKPLPVIVFSHGLYTCATQSRFLTEALADAGYFVVAPNHHDAYCAFTIGRFGFSRLPGKPAMLWTDEDYRDRAEDIRELVQSLRDDVRFRGVADVDRLALMGHSLGGYTVLGLAGAWPKWTLPGVKAVLAFAPYAMPFAHSEGLRHLQAPVMFQAGQFDPVFTGPMQVAFDQSPQPKYFVEIEHAFHLTWSDLGMLHPRSITAYALAFFDRYLKDGSEDALLDGQQAHAAATVIQRVAGPALPAL
jgi:predicted dienelactone hydrolase